MKKLSGRIPALACLASVVLCATAVLGDDGAAPAAANVGKLNGLDTAWVLIAAFLVFFMQPGFAMVETGFTRAKNACNILMKNFLDYCAASIAFFLVGYALMFGADAGGFIGTSGFCLIEAVGCPDNLPIWAFWFFQVTFCGAAATIVAGSMAERMKFPAYLTYSIVISALVYPIIGHWIWGGGWLAQKGFVDFAGSTVVHATGGISALVGAALLGPRIGKFDKAGNAKAIAGHSIPLAALGVFILWFAWFGFNPGSTLGVVGQESLIGLVAANTNLAAAAGAISAMITVWIAYGKPDLSMTMNGALAGLVAITAGCAFVAPWAAIIIGLAGGVIVVLGVALLDKIGVDDPVGAVSVHGFNGMWGTIAIGLFGSRTVNGSLPHNGLFYGGGLTQLGIQATGTFVSAAFAFCAMGIIFYAIKKTIGLRVSREEEYRGLDIGEHGMESYSGFQIFMTE